MSKNTNQSVSRRNSFPAFECPSICIISRCFTQSISIHKTLFQISLPLFLICVFLYITLKHCIHLVIVSQRGLFKTFICSVFHFHILTTESCLSTKISVHSSFIYLFSDFLFFLLIPYLAYYIWLVLFRFLCVFSSYSLILIFLLSSHLRAS